VRSFLKVVVLGALAIGPFFASLPAVAAVDDSLGSFLRAYLWSNGGRFATDDTLYLSARAPGANGRHPLILVYLMGRFWCGSSGCTLLMLEGNRGQFKVVGRMTDVQLPVYTLQSSYHGFPDLAVRVRGGGETRGYYAKLTFDGNRYPLNPTVAPAVRLPREPSEFPAISIATEPKHLP
jgi:hypothetical protein